MSKKITFQELIDAIAEESGNTKQFTHDFIKDFVSFVNDRLQENESINTAGFGKFELRKMGEREGVNPQTGEKITIPAHHKAIFKPYKNLRDLVNAPYEHLEAELIEEDVDEQNDTSADQSDVSTDEEEQQFIPTAPPPSVESETEESQEEHEGSRDTHPFILDMQNANDNDSEDTLEASEETQESTDDSDPFDFGDESEEESPEKEETTFELEDFGKETVETEADDNNSEDESDIFEEGPIDTDEGTESELEEPVSEQDFDDDIVEFTPEYSVSDEADEVDDIEETEEDPFDLEEDVDDAPIEDPDEEEYEMYALPGDEEDVEMDEEELAEEELTLNEEFNEAEESVEKEEHAEELQVPHEPPVFKDRTIQKKRNTGGSMLVIAAAIIVLLLAGGAWYFLMYNNQDSDAANNTSSASTGITATVPQNEEADDSPADKNANEQESNTDDTNTNTSATSGKTAGTITPDTNSKTSTASTTNSVFHTVEKGETLWGLADVNYRNPYRWPWIYDENQPEIENPNIIKIGQKLEIPMPQGSNGSLTNNDSLQVAIAFAETYSWYKERGMEEAKFYLYTAKRYHTNVLQYVNIQVDDDDLAFANQE